MRTQVGIQEKTAFVAQGKKLSGAALYSPIISIPATIELLLVRLRHLARLCSAKRHYAGLGFAYNNNGSRTDAISTCLEEDPCQVGKTIVLKLWYYEKE